jgi:hypothetical protein
MTENAKPGRPPSPERQFWRNAIQEIRKNSVKTVEDAAKQLIALVTLLSGLYFHAITFGQIPKDQVGLKILFVGPLAVWVLCLLVATLVFLPLRFVLSPYDPDEIERIVGRDLAWKYRLLLASLVLLVISLSWQVVAAWVYLEVYVPK